MDGGVSVYRGPPHDVERGNVTLFHVQPIYRAWCAWDKQSVVRLSFRIYKSNLYIVGFLTIFFPILIKIVKFRFLVMACAVD